MVSWWPFDETAGTISANIVGSANDGIHINTPIPITGTVKGALTFVGAQYVEVGNQDAINFGTGDFSIHSWVRMETAYLYEPLLDKRSPESIGYSLYFQEGHLSLNMADANGRYDYGVEYGPNLQDGTWHFISATVDRDQTDGGRLYVDGVLIHTFDPTGPAGTITNDANLRIGNSYDGIIDEMAFFDRALSAGEISTIYEAGSAGQCKPVNTLRIAPYEVIPGSPFTISIIADLDSQLASASIGVNYNPARFSIGGCQADPEGVFDLRQCNPNFTSSSARFNVTSLSDVTGSIRLADLMFQRIGTINSELTLNVLSFFDPNGDPIDFTIIDTDVDSGNDKIQGSVWSDTNANGLRDAGELGLAGIPVRLQSSNDCTLSMTATTDNNGEYTFSDLDPKLSYFITFEAPDGTIFSPQDVGGDDTVDSDVHPNTGQTNLISVPANHIEAGIITQSSDDIGRILGTIYGDDNGNGIQEEEDLGICGVAVNLLDRADNILATTVSDAGGLYSFQGLDVNRSYTIQVILPDDLSSSPVNSSFDIDNQSLLVILSDSNNFEVFIDFSAAPSEIVGETLDCTGGKRRRNHRSAEFDLFRSLAGVNSMQAYPGVIEGTIWDDTQNANGIRDASDGVTDAGVWVVCTCAPGYFADDEENEVLTVRPNEDGTYRFTKLNPDGKYIIKVLLAGNKKLTQRIPDDQRDSDPDPITRESNLIDLAQRPGNKIEINAGLLDEEIAQGDVNCDGIANAPDGLWIIQSAVGKRGIDTACPPPASFDDRTRLYVDACDVDGDSACGDLDALRILRCAIGFRTAPCPQDLVSASMNMGRSDIAPVEDAQSTNHTIEIPSQQVSPGSTFTVPLIATVDQALGTAVIDVAYDASQLEIVSCQADKDDRFGIGECNTDLANKVSLGLLLGEGISETWHLADITFKHIGTSQAGSTLGIDVKTLTDIHGNPLSSTAFDGEVIIGYRAYLPVIQR